MGEGLQVKVVEILDVNIEEDVLKVTARTNMTEEQYKAYINELVETVLYDIPCDPDSNSLLWLNPLEKNQANYYNPKVGTRFSRVVR